MRNVIVLCLFFSGAWYFGQHGPIWMSLLCVIGVVLCMLVAVLSTGIILLEKYSTRRKASH